MGGDELTASACRRRRSLAGRGRNSGRTFRRPTRPTDGTGQGGKLHERRRPPWRVLLRRLARLLVLMIVPAHRAGRHMERRRALVTDTGTLTNGNAGRHGGSLPTWRVPPVLCGTGPLRSSHSLITNSRAVALRLIQKVARLRSAAIYFAFSPPDSLRASVGGLRCASPGLLIARDHQRRNALDRVRADAELLGDLVN